MKFKRNIYWKVAGIVLILVVAIGAGITVLNRNNEDDTSYSGNGDKIGGKYKMESFGDGNYIYNCSKEIEVIYEGGALGPGDIYRPVDQEEFKKYCRSDAAIEYRAVIDILRRQDVNEIISKHNTIEASVKALGHTYIHDKDYLRRILPAYSDMKIDCIIVVHSPEGTRFFIENGEVHKSHDDHQYIEVSSEDFLTSLNKASDTDINNFWLGLH